MRDLAFIGFLAALVGLGFRRPFLFVLAYVYIDVVSPQRLTYYLLNTVSISMYAGLLAIGAWALVDDKRGLRVAPRQLLLLALLGYCWATTVNADFRLEAEFKWDWVWKSLVFAALLPLTLRTRLRIESLLLFMTLSVGSIVIVGGIKTLAGGGGYGQLNLMVDNNTGLYESSIISAVAIAVVPVILWLAKHGTVFPPDWRVRTFAYALCFACLLMPIGTSARTGLLCIGLLAVLMLREVKRRVLYLGLLAAMGAAAVPLIPSAVTERAGTIRDYQTDESASTRLAVWRWTLDYVKDKPFGGGFEAYRQNRVMYQVQDKDGDAGGTVVDQARAYHSSYFEMLGEQGWPGLAIWLLIHLGGVFRMEVLRRRHREGELAWAGSLAGALQHAHLIYLLGSAFTGIALNPFIYLFVGAQIGLDLYLSRRRSEQPMRLMRADPTELAAA